ncbi:MAG TPA: LuxR C-terminal-related transcriptional regulator [Solirubrobacteraceae bacterium]|jgi:DNA-binding CsgD family transcriptional regulator|nr:LuxR C-terminal-related transcriptional regulator [Solirubrobacteraceae bacterium]
MEANRRADMPAEAGEKPEQGSEERDPRVSLILRVTDLLGRGVFRPDETADAVAAMACEEVADYCGVALLSSDGRALHPVGLGHRDAGMTEELNTRSDLAWRPLGGVSEDALSQGQARLVTDINWHEVARGRESAFELFKLLDLGSAIVAPMRAGGIQIGIAAVGRTRSSLAYRADDVPYVQALADEVGFAAATSCLREELDHLRGDSEPSALPKLAVALTDREQEILRLIAQGLTNREIAEHIYLSVRTVEWHRSRLAAKLGVSSRSDLVAMAQRLLP